MAGEIANLDRLKSQLLTSGLSQRDQPLFQIINQLIDALRGTINITTGGSGGGGPIGGQTFITYADETGSLPNSLQAIPGNGIQFTKQGKKLLISANSQIVITDADAFAQADAFPIQGQQGIPGKQGERGIPGLDGEDGLEGIGFQGERGLTGATGPAGLDGSCDDCACDPAMPLAIGPMSELSEASAITQALVAGDFTGSGALTWTGVTVTDYSYLLFGKIMILFYKFGPSTTAGAGVDLRVTIPRGQIAKKTQSNCFRFVDATGLAGTGQSFVVAAGTQLNLRQGPGVNWPAGATTFVEGTHIFEVQ